MKEIDAIIQTGIPAILVMGVMVLIMVYIQREKIKSMVWRYIQSLDEEDIIYIQLTIKEMGVPERLGLYSLYDTLPPMMKAFMGRETFEGLIDSTVNQIVEHILTSDTFKDYKK